MPHEKSSSKGCDQLAHPTLRWLQGATPEDTSLAIVHHLTSKELVKMGLGKVILWLPVILLIVDRMFLACRAALGASEAFAAGFSPPGRGGGADSQIPAGREICSLWSFRDRSGHGDDLAKGARASRNVRRLWYFPTPSSF